MENRASLSCPKGKTVRFLGVPIAAVDTSRLIRCIASFAAGDRKRTVMYANAACMLLAEKDPAYKDALCRADLVYADGVGVTIGARLWGKRLPGRSTAADFIYDLCRLCAENHISVFLLGAQEGVAESAAAKLMEKIPGLKIAGTHHGYFSEKEEQGIIQKINSSGAELLIVGFGAPKQELWMLNNADSLAPSCLWGVGGLFDFVSGRTARGPQWLLDHGFEWLCRLIVEPRRLWKRYIPGNVIFILTVLKHRIRDALRRN